MSETLLAVIITGIIAKIDVIFSFLYKAITTIWKEFKLWRFKCKQRKLYLKYCEKLQSALIKNEIEQILSSCEIWQSGGYEYINKLRQKAPVFLRYLLETYAGNGLQYHNASSGFLQEFGCEQMTIGEENAKELYNFIKTIFLKLLINEEPS